MIKSALEARDLATGYHQKTIINSLNLSIPKGKITIFIGSNGCGKSTLLKTFARLISPKRGQIILDGTDIQSQSSKNIAKKMAILPQSPHAVDTLTVKQLVSMGRYPHQNFFSQWSDEDELFVHQALTKTNLLDLENRAVDSLSGGQKQRAWIAMTLAQNSDVLLLDEPTTYLDLAHQIEVLDLLFELNQGGKTIVMVLHDINLACRYADHIVAIKKDLSFIEGTPTDIITTESMQEILSLDCLVIKDPLFNTPLCVPKSKILMEQTA